MKKLLIATTALVATAGMASADITISGHAAAGIYSGLAIKPYSAVVAAAAQKAASLVTCCTELYSMQIQQAYN